MGRRFERYELVHAAHEFILKALPFRYRESRQALTYFVEQASACHLPAADTDAVLLTLLCVLDPHTHGRLPSLVDRYLGLRRNVPNAIERFQHCVEDVIRYRGAGSIEVQQAIAQIEARFADCHLTQAAIAEALGLSPQHLSTLFTRQTGLTFGEYLRDVRLDRAAAFLMRRTASIKEIWVAVGYNDASNFGHQFRTRFGTTPREYRSRRIESVVSSGVAASHVDHEAALYGSPSDRALLIVDDNPCTRETLGRHFSGCGYSVSLAATGESAIRLAGQRVPDGIILDHHLPDMDGLECLRCLRRGERRCRPAVLLFTADWDVQDEEDDIAGLGAMFASKLCDLDEVQRLVGSLLAARDAFASWVN